MAVCTKQEQLYPVINPKDEVINIASGYDNLVLSIEGNGSFSVKLLGSVSQELEEINRVYYPIFLVSLTKGSKVTEVTSNDIVVMDVRFLQYVKLDVQGDVKVTGRFSIGQ